LQSLRDRSAAAFGQASFVGWGIMASSTPVFVAGFLIAGMAHFAAPL
jgi:hypothetical protein